jgi:hypothetical protein
MSEAQDLIGFTGGGGENQVWPMLRILKYFLKIGNDFSHFYKKYINLSKIIIITLLLKIVILICPLTE